MATSDDQDQQQPAAPEYPQPVHRVARVSVPMAGSEQVRTDRRRPTGEPTEDDQDAE